MSDERPSLPAPQGNIIRRAITQGKLIWRLMIDKRVSLFAKLIPFAGVAYLFFPLDFLPDMLLPVLGQLDDLGIFLGSLWLFTELCPQDVVQEHWRALNSVIPGAWREAGEKDAPQPDSPVIEPPQKKE